MDNLDRFAAMDQVMSQAIRINEEGYFRSHPVMSYLLDDKFLKDSKEFVNKPR